jgi:hypothetical protein
LLALLQSWEHKDKFLLLPSSKKALSISFRQITWQLPTHKLVEVSQLGPKLTKFHKTPVRPSSERTPKGNNRGSKANKVNKASRAVSKVALVVVNKAALVVVNKAALVVVNKVASVVRVVLVVNKVVLVAKVASAVSKAGLAVAVVVASAVAVVS